MVISETVKKIIDFLKNLTDIKWIIVIDKTRGTIAYTYKIIREDLAHSVGNTVLDLSVIIGKLKNFIGSLQIEAKRSHSIAICLESNMIEMEEYLNYIYAFYGDRRIYRPISHIFNMLRNGRDIRCYSCGKDLTLATYICPKCGRTIPFITSNCPFCGSNVKIKNCPFCKTLVNSITGQKIYKNMIILVASVLTGLTVMSSSIYMGLISAPPMWDVAIIGLIMGMLIIYIGSRLSYKTY